MKLIVVLRIMQIGNPSINDETDAKGMYEYYESHGLISKDTLNRILRHCDFIGNSSSSGGASTTCLVGILESQRATAALDVYNIYAPLCSNSHNTSTTNEVIKPLFFNLLLLFFCKGFVILCSG